MSSLVIIAACAAAIGGCKWFERSEQRRAARLGVASRRTARRARMIAHGIAAGSPPRWNSRTEAYIKDARARGDRRLPSRSSAAPATPGVEQVALPALAPARGNSK